ncbi:hypothetical protein OIU77_018926 [Salix suchowensis]|uniref:Uncharacterized protein n=1 Tax=Salix suchowensis TaxID=1278906 RepID=A0ABQ9CGB4_9ROSI|nr:hypothetical protein OIU77_018926 [Salix suchowensis]
MYEYSLPSLSQDTEPSLSQDIVLCRMRKSRPQKTRKWRSHAGGVDDATNTMSQQARVGEGFDHQQQITAAPAEIESEIPNRVKLDNLDKFLQNDDIDNDQMDVSPKELEDLRRELGELLSPDLADGLPSIQTTPEADANRSYVVQENGVEMIYNAFPNSNGW